MLIAECAVILISASTLHTLHYTLKTLSPIKSPDYIDDLLMIILCPEKYFTV